MSNEIIFLLLAFIISIFATPIGFGSALLLVPLSSFLLPIKSAIAVLTIFFMASNVSRIIIFRKHIDWKITLFILYGAIPFVFAGALLLVYAPSDIIEKILGIIILLYAINDYLNITKKVKLKNYAISMVGGLFGFFSGIIGTGNAITAALLTHMGIRKERFIATMAITALFVNAIKIGIYSKFALVTIDDIPLVAALIIIAFVGAYLGKNLVKMIKPELFRRLVLILLLVVSLKLLFF
ncbi:sulfite exporter TauE/SafE family protein [Candidatus Woesearchaeota archaeon]|nr:sulfite exporter TauE/SafE family protein [Candidatus Woesearchaeota archaeon]